MLKCKLSESADGPLISVSAHHRRKCILRFDLLAVNDERLLELLMSKLQRFASKGRVRTIKLSVTDEIFKKCTISELKDHGNKYLKSLRIILIKPRKYIEDEEERLKIIKLYHDDPLFGGHKGTNRCRIKGKFRMEKHGERHMHVCEKL